MLTGVATTHSSRGCAFGASRFVDQLLEPAVAEITKHQSRRPERVSGQLRFHFGVVNMNEPPSLLRRMSTSPSLSKSHDVTGSARWLKVLLGGVTSNRSAIGARITARYGGRTQAQEVTAQSSFYSANDRRLHFGLGAATKADLTIRWPNGATEQVPNVDANQLVVIREGAGIVRRERFG